MYSELRESSEGELIEIANPAYDVVFKYLMEDKEVAMLFLSELTGLDIVDIDFTAKEYTYPLPTFLREKFKNVNLTFYRLDFKAKVRVSAKSDELQVVMIEVQRFRYPSDECRFRIYLGEQYANLENCADRELMIGPYPLILIFFFGYNVCGEDEAILEVDHRVHNKDNIIYNCESSFFKALTHKIIIVQLNVLQRLKLTGKLKTDFERVLSLFDPGIGKYFMKVPIEGWGRFSKIIKRLYMAVQQRDIVKTMELEDALARAMELHFRYMEERIEELERRLREEQEARLLIEIERRRLAEEKKRAEQEKEQILNRTILAFYSSGRTIEEIADLLGLSVEEVRKYLRDG